MLSTETTSKLNTLLKFDQVLTYDPRFAKANGGKVTRALAWLVLANKLANDISNTEKGDCSKLLFLIDIY